MTPILNFQPSTAPTTHPRTPTNVDAGLEHNIIGALLEALTAPDRYRLIECGGELFIEPTEPAH